MISQGYVHELLGAKVRNVGRMAVTVEQVEAVFPNGMKLSHPQGQVGPSLPYRLEAHSSETWLFPMQPIRAAVYANAQSFGQPDSQAVHVSVELGSGKTVATKQRILVEGG